MPIDAPGRLDQDFLDSVRYREAITHRSAGSSNNERLEYLGDAVLGLVIAEYLFRNHPVLDEGDLSRLRAYLVRKETLAEIAGEQDLGQAMILGQGERKSGGQRRQSILADGLEAIFGALYLHAGFEAVKDHILSIYASRLADLPAAEALKDAKTRLQEQLQARNIELPEYTAVQPETANPRVFQTRCYIASYGIERIGEGASKRKAEQDAARAALQALADHLAS